MIRLADVHKHFGRVHAVRGVSLEIPKGQVVGILGPNGAGKTTTIRMIAAAIPPSGGVVTVDGLDSVHHSRAVRARLGYLPEGNPLYPEMRIEQYLAYRAALFGLPRADARRAVDRSLERCWLADVRRRRIGHLSKGYKQRVGLAAALLHDPPVLILDEPTSGLDPSQISQVRDLIRALAGDRTMLVISHILPEVEQTCDRIVVFAGGRVVADGRPADLARAAAGRWRLRCELRPSPGAAAAEPAVALMQADGVAEVRSDRLPDGWSRCAVAPARPDLDLREAVALAAARHGMIVRELVTIAPTLESVYMRLVGAAPAGEEGAEA
ncbi:MAG: ABC transporter ATP-binding protein [Phycisphaerales bacterium]|nr:ABC transporter ATP-binding protein [Phycisphaerales bacterium]